MLTEFAARPFIRRALANPFDPVSVLSFFTGVDYQDPNAPKALREGLFINVASPFWFGGGKDYDDLCLPFCAVIREAGKQALDDDPWQTTIDGKIAQLILCDQLSRNCFRGTDEAFAYDGTSCTIARELANVALSDTTDLEGTFYPPYSVFVTTALMHSEQLQDHETSLEILEWVKPKTSPRLDSWWDGQRAFELEHKAVIDRFGRYPHRNAKLGRQSTPEELEWLSNDDELPGWAKSQM